MNIQRNVKNITILPEESVINALQKMCQTGSRVVLLTHEDGVLEGIFTDGDLRLWLAHQKDADLNRPVSEAANRSFISARVIDPPEQISRLFSETIRFVPLLDERGRLVALAINEEAKFSIGDFSISSTAPAYVIAEIGNNHNGQMDMARQLIDHAAMAGANCAKFQIRHMQSLYRDTGLNEASDEDLGTQYVLDLLAKYQLPDEQLFTLFDYCKASDIEPLCTPWDLSSLAALERYGMNAYKVASADLTNHELLESLALTRKPLLVSTGMSTEEEIIQAINLLNQFNASYLLLHCNSAYPAPFADINLHYMERLRELSGRLVGYSGHERGYHVAIAAVSLGARVIEKHITLDRSLEGSDHKVSLIPSEFSDMVRSIRQVEQSLGLCGERKLSQGEIINRNSLAKSLVASRPIGAGETIKADAVSVRSPGRGLQPNSLKKLINRKAKRTFNVGDFFYPSDLLDESLQARNYKFRRRWGVPVRYHDFKQILTNTNPDLLEFHLSYKDLDLDYNSYLFEPLEALDLVIHAPELFSGDHLLDLCSEDADYRHRSISEMQRVINLTRQLNAVFPKTNRPLIVANVGGFSRDHSLQQDEVLLKEKYLAESFSKLDLSDVEVIAQTMPPYPWHFGGQSHHNLFVDPRQIVRLCMNLDLRVCLDVSHSKLACNHLKQSFKSFIDLVGPYTAHLHIADASGSDGEGLQIGDGEIDFKALADDLNRTCPHASFIPEIWQGHNNDGEGFWFALTHLEGLL
jgi:sialic acid synthase SpsE/sugar phosphate isomerase/epimerase